MANHIVRPDWRGNLVVITTSPLSGRVYRSAFPYAEPKQAFAHCMAECQADQTIERMNLGELK